MGVVGLLVDTTVDDALQLVAGLDHLLARPMSFLCAATRNWFLNRRYTFVYGREDAAGGQWVSYVLVMLVGLVVNVGDLCAPHDPDARLLGATVGALLIGIALGTAGNFLAARWYVFRRRVSPPSFVFKGRT